MTPRWCAVATCGRPAEGRFCATHGALTDVAVPHVPDHVPAGQGTFPASNTGMFHRVSEKRASDLLVPCSPYGWNAAERGFRTFPRVGPPTRNTVDRLRAAGIWTGHAWGVCTECGEGRMVSRAGDRQACNLTPKCKGRFVPESTPTPRQAAQRVVTGLFAATRAVMGARRPLKVPYPKLPKENPDVLPDL